MTSSRRIRTIINRAMFSLAALMVLFAFPAPLLTGSVSADSTSPTTCSPVAPAPTGTSQPTGSSAGTFHYDSCTGLWENQYYTYNPSTQTYAPQPGYEPTYTCNTTTYTWEETAWNYVSSNNDYEQQTFAVSSAPASAGTCVAPVVSSLSTASTPATDTSDTSGDSGVSGSSTDGTALSDTTNVTLNNNLTSTATSGNVSVLQNTTAGNATSGNALASATVINSVNSISGLVSGPVATFTKNIDGDVSGDIIIDPNLLQPSSVNLNGGNNVTLNSQTSGTINNNLNLSAGSGDVTTSQNTKVGDATSGGAAAMANVVNMLNSYVSAGQSFIGTININGDLDGNILMPPAFLSGLIASGAPSTTINLSQAGNASLSDSSTTNIDNQINSLATSGDVTQARNTTAGNATSGTAGTAVTVYNLTGHQIVGTNSVLVFVNVMGKWVGVIVDAPAGSHTALLGGGITSNSSNNYDVNASTDNAINNYINVAAKSGDVNSSENTSAGNATSGNANTAVSLANMSNDSLSLTGWLGILFINVFGSWYGNFGVLAASPGSTGATGSNETASAGSSTGAGSRPMFQFVPKSSGVSTGIGSSGDSSSIGTPAVTLASAKTTGNVLGATTSDPPAQGPTTSDKSDPSSKLWLIIPAGLLLVGIAMVLMSRKFDPANSKR